MLKTLEEPPAHVVFVLATTEPYKMLDTVRSRAQRFDFHPVPADLLIDYLGDISAREVFSVQPEALSMIAGHAGGSVRDALSLLEQVAALGGGSVEATAVARALGLADKEAFAALAGAVADQDAPAALGLVASLASQGADLRRFVSEALSFSGACFWRSTPRISKRWSTSRRKRSKNGAGTPLGLRLPTCCAPSINWPGPSQTSDRAARRG